MSAMLADALPYVLGGATSLIGSLVGGASTGVVSLATLTVVSLGFKYQSKLVQPTAKKDKPTTEEPLLKTVIVPENDKLELEREVSTLCRARLLCAARSPD